MQAFAELGEEFVPMLVGCVDNRRHWLTMAEGGTAAAHDDTRARRDDEEDDECSADNGRDEAATSPEIYA